MENLWQYLVLLLLNSLLCLGIYKACDYELGIKHKAPMKPYINLIGPNNKSIFWFIKYYGTKWFGETIMAPICGCIICMSSIHSIYVFWFFHSFTFTNTLLYTGYVFCLAGLNTINERYT